MRYGGVAMKAYLAGIIDGEGYIGAARRLPTKRNTSASGVIRIGLGGRSNALRRY
jgi:hypothetical protein